MNGYGYFVGVGSWALVLAMVFAPIILFGDNVLSWLGLQKKKFQIYVNILFVLILVTFLFSPLYFEFPKYPNHLFSVDLKTGERKEYVYGTFEYGKKLTWLPSSTEELGASAFDIPVSNQSKSLGYRIHGRITDPWVYLEKNGKWFSFTNGRKSDGDTDRYVSERLEYLSFEYAHNGVSDEISDFYNPLDEGQQQRFKKTVGAWYNEHTKTDGITVVVDGFYAR